MKNTKKVLTIICMCLVIGLMTGCSSNNFFVVNQRELKDDSIKNKTFESKRINGYNYIEKYSMKWKNYNGNIGYSMLVPVIPSGTYYIDPLADGQNTVQVKSDIINLEYRISNLPADFFDSAYGLVKSFGAKSMESNNVKGYAYSKTESNSKVIQIRMYKTDILDNSSTKGWTLATSIIFDNNNYNQAKPILEELSKIFNYDIMEIVDSIK